ncbi:MAG: hypothetical protein AAFO29_15735, partial [Actinomycetota bacterium]
LVNIDVDVDQWIRWRHSRRGRRCWDGWARERPSLAGWTTAELVDPRRSAATDRLQHDLVALAQSGHGDAAVTLLVQLRPGLLRLVRSRARYTGETWAEAGDEVRAVFHETLYRHPLHRRPQRIAANLVLDTRQRLLRAGGGRPPAPPLSEQGVTTAAGPDPDELAVAWTLRRAIDRLPGSSASRALTAEAAYRAWILDQPRSEVADAVGLRPAALDTRLHRLRRVVRQEWAEAA